MWNWQNFQPTFTLQVLAVRVNWEQPWSNPHELHWNMTSPVTLCKWKQKLTVVSTYGLLRWELVADVIEEKAEYNNGPFLSSGPDMGSWKQNSFQITAVATVTLNSRQSTQVKMAWCNMKKNQNVTLREGGKAAFVYSCRVDSFKEHMYGWTCFSHLISRPPFWCIG